MQTQLTAQEQRAFDAIVDELAGSTRKVRLIHVAALVATWLGLWAAIINTVDTPLVSFGFFLAMAAVTSVIGWALLSASVRSINWDHSMGRRESLRALLRNLR